jgi:hypothetical protein
MRVLNRLIALHERTKHELQSSGRVGLSKRMFLRTYEINRIGKNYDDINRRDVGTEMILKSYLARKVFINEKNLRGKYYIIDDYELEQKFTAGLWDIFCVEVFGEYLPELPVPTTYAELDRLFRDDVLHMSFSLHKAVKEAVIHSQIQESQYCQSMKSFDLFCSLPGAPGWTAFQNGAILAEPGRVEAPQRLLQAALGMYRFDHLGAPEPYKHFWKERATMAMKKAIVVLQNSYIVKFRNGAMYDLPFLPERFEPVSTFKWNIKRT